MPAANKIITVLFIICVTTANACLAENNHQAIEHTPLNIVTEIAPPLQFLNGDKLDGQTTSKVRAMLAEASLEAQITPYPWARAFYLATTKPNTLIYPLVRTPERENSFHWIGKLLTFKMSVIKLKSNNAIALNKLNDAKNFRLGLMRGDYAHKLIDNAGFTENEHYTLSSELSKLITQLYSGKIDAMIADLPLLKVMAISQGFDPEMLVSVYNLGEPVGVYIAAGKNTKPTYVDALSKALNRISPYSNKLN